MSVATTENSVNEDNSVVVLDVDNEGTSIRGEIMSLASGRPVMFSSLTGNDFESRIEVVNAMTNSVPVAENLNKVINIKHVIIQPVALANEETGEIKDQPRIVLMDADGTAYHAISAGLFRSVQNIVQILGHPATWPAPLPIKIIRAGQGTRQYFTARIVRDTKSK